MPTQVSTALRRFVSGVREFTIAQRTLAIIGLAVLVLGVATLGIWLSRPTYTPLFSGLAPKDASAIVEQLRAESVPYELTGGGGSILVPEQYVYDQRLKAAAAGLPSSSNGGYSLLDDMGVTSSDFQQSVTYKRALEGELAATIGAMKDVKMASVRLAIPEDSVFVSERQEPTASVFVETERGVDLSAEQVQAIVQLTSASIDGMKAANVAVVDADGTVLSAVGVGATGTADQRGSDYEERVRQAVQAMLDRVAGVGNATVVVSADMSYESAQRLEEQFTVPDDAPALNESTHTETHDGGRAATGVLGPDNIAVPGGEQDGVYTSESVTRNNAVNKVTETRTIPAGAITRQTVSVALNEAAASDLNITNISALVAAAAGINTDRGDEVTVEVVPFNAAGAAAAAEALAAAEAEAAAERLTTLITTVAIVLGLAVLIVVAIVLLSRRSQRERDAVEIGELKDMLYGPAQTVPLLGATPPPAELPAAPPAPDAGSDSARARAEIEALAERDPQRTAEFLRSLMDDRQPA
ncbi:flagellar basal-body MS-ring/collar protein FliF [Cryobacterium sp. BB736]|uniref:flagellar basal-body MS-ring/collar protein FliF n=1 Tax=Cryobacterium sp. BB736 TaxID=2746963 RepID=UPI001873B60F|nr:flagellar basal-body MS-ring/collar protein FliF [Cryobacterium sp. BB736]